MTVRTRRLTPLGAVVRGLVAGAIGTAAMTAWQELSARLLSSDGGDASNESSVDPWEQASAPAQVAKRIGEAVFQRHVSSALIPLLTNAMHWGYGTGWGGVYGVLAGSSQTQRPLRAGVAFGTGVWTMSYVQMVPMGLYQLPWEYSPTQVTMDLSYHLVYGVAGATAFAALTC